MKGKGLVFVLAVSLILTITSVCLLPQNLLAEYSFWVGTDLTQTTMPNPNFDSSQPPGPANQPSLIYQARSDPHQAKLLAEAVKSNMPSLFSLLLFSNNPKGDSSTTIWDKKKAWAGYTLLTLLQGYQDPDTGKTYGAILVDMDGTVVNKWELMGLSKMLPNGSVIGGKGQSDELIGWPYLVQQNWCGEDEWVWKGPVENAWPAEKDWKTPIDNGRCDGVYDDGEYSLSNLLGCRAEVKAGDLLVSGWHHDYQREGNPVGYYYPGAEQTESV